LEDRIIVVDSFPGSGKTSWAIQYINTLSDDLRVIYITPYLDEVERIIKSCPEKEFVQPDRKKGKGSKFNHLIQLLLAEKNIVSTHALFSNINDELIDLLRASNYILILDEVFQTVERFDIVEERVSNEVKDAITKKDVETLLSQGLIKVEPDFSIKWIDLNKPLSKYSNLINLSERGLIYFVNGSLLLWSFPIEVFQEGIFSNIFILTHRFESQLQSYYYKYFDLDYTKYIVNFVDGSYKIEKKDFNEKESEWKRMIKEKITIIEENKINNIGNIYQDSKDRSRSSALSKTWYSNHPDMLKVMQNNLNNYYINMMKSKASERLWTCFKEELPKLKNKNLSAKSWLACNARATNNYADKTVLAYLINRYVDPFYDAFFEHKNITIDQDEFALSEMIQWIWRSAVRNNQNITIYIPSIRMRKLLKSYLESN
jgi:hypothetical protein